MQKNYLSFKNAFLFLMFFCVTTLVSAQNVQFASYRAPKITNKKVSFGHRKVDEKRQIDVVIIHSTYNASSQDSFSIDGVVEQFKKYGVSAHYVIDRKGNIFQLIDEKDISYHAGAGSLPERLVIIRNQGRNSPGSSRTVYLQPRNLTRMTPCP